MKTAEWYLGSDILITDKDSGEIHYLTSEGISTHPDEDDLEKCLDGIKSFENNSNLFLGNEAVRLYDSIKDEIIFGGPVVREKVEEYYKRWTPSNHSSFRS